MSVAALQAELQQLGYEFRKDSAGNHLKKADLVARLTAARTLGAPVAPSVAVAPARKRARSEDCVNAGGEDSCGGVDEAQVVGARTGKRHTVQGNPASARSHCVTQEHPVQKPT